jgi:hypothetical protein
MVKTCVGCVDFSTCVKDQRAKLEGCKFRLEQNSVLTKEEEAPLDACTKCKQRRCLTDGVICKKVEKLLVKISSGRINSKEFSTDKVEILYQLHKERESGWRKKPITSSEDWGDS